MTDKIILYSSKYGTSKAYAEKLAELTGIAVYSLDEAPGDLPKTIIYFAPIYMGLVWNIRKFATLIPEDTEVIFMAQGLMDYDKELDKRAEIEDQLPEHWQIYFLPGAVQMSELKFRDKLIIKAVQKAQGRKEDFPEEADLTALDEIVQMM